MGTDLGRYREVRRAARHAEQEYDHAEYARRPVIDGPAYRAELIEQGLLRPALAKATPTHVVRDPVARHQPQGKVRVSMVRADGAVMTRWIWPVRL